mmetsp:Transcript_4574/g.8065  ORF Transcript_4574/g.8065 Transcript_4574/m.8065 type:complete len:221 (+) Transcript_4574:2067-2729(+)
MKSVSRARLPVQRVQPCLQAALKMMSPFAIRPSFNAATPVMPWTNTCSLKDSVRPIAGLLNQTSYIRWPCDLEEAGGRYTAPSLLNQSSLLIGRPNSLVAPLEGILFFLGAASTSSKGCWLEVASVTSSSLVPIIGGWHAALTSSSNVIAFGLPNTKAPPTSLICTSVLEPSSRGNGASKLAPSATGAASFAAGAASSSDITRASCRPRMDLRAVTSSLQ